MTRRSALAAISVDASPEPQLTIQPERQLRTGRDADFASARQQNRKHDQNRHCPDIDEDLREADELRVKLQIKRGQSCEGDGERERG